MQSHCEKTNDYETHYARKAKVNETKKIRRRLKSLIYRTL